MKNGLRGLSVVAGLLLAATAVFAAPREIYPDPALAKSELAAALRKAQTTHKRVIVDFGGNWCADCQVLDIYFHNAQNLPLLEKNYVLVDVNIGRFDKNLEMAQRYGIPLSLGVPALAVLSPQGKLIFSQSTGQFEKMQHMSPQAVTDFLIRWKPLRPGCSAVRTDC